MYRSSCAGLTRRQLLRAALLPVGATLLAACGVHRDESEVTATPALGPDGHFEEVQVFGDGTRHLIPIEDVVDGGPGKDGIPSIDEPKFAGSEDWDALDYHDDGWVIGVEVDGERRAYPFQVLVWHEIVNDLFNGVPLLVTYCPLCGSGIVFRRQLASGATPEFGVSGRLYNSDVLMYDRATDTVWAQLTGTAVIGELTGERLELVPSELVTWGAWTAAYPDSKVLTRDTGYQRDYDRQPYGDYDTRSSISFPVAAEDDRLHPKTRITGVELPGSIYVAYPDDAVRDFGPVNDVVGGTPLLVVADGDGGGNVLVFVRAVDGPILDFTAEGRQLVDAITGTRWRHDGHAVEGELAGMQLEQLATTKAFWFAWFAFHQDTELWLPD